jgi:glycosyltransferase involved in cell wall biosynthesis
VGVLPSSDDLARRMGTPVKLFNYMSVGLPIVANDIGGWTEIIKQEKVGIITNSDPKSFAEAIVNITNNPRSMQEYSIRSLELIKTKYNWDLCIQPLLYIYEKLVG